ncbi:MAG: hypothetical protein II005_00895 [Turicibacter sp.]|nr:hypothetical protein [Turicibacter sp.]
MPTNSPFYTDEELSEILNNREESIINIIRMNYDKLVNKKYERNKRISRTDIFNMVYDIVNEIHGITYEKAESENIFRVVIKEGKKDAYDFREVPAYKIAMISDIRMRIFYNLNGQKHEMQIDKYQLLSVEPL